MTPKQSEKIAAAVMAELKDIRQTMITRPDADTNTNLLHAILTSVLFIKYTLASEFAETTDNRNGELKQ